jgi:hypothetical protein
MPDNAQGWRDMETTTSVETPGPRNPRDRRTGALRRAIGYWEPRRLVYNLILGAIVVGWLTISWPHFRPVMTWAALGQLLVLGLIANACYCAAYVFDLAIGHSSAAADLGRMRSGLWIAGTAFAMLLTNYWIADEIYPFVR